MAATKAESYKRLQQLLESVPKEKLISILGDWFGGAEFEEFDDFVESELKGE